MLLGKSTQTPVSLRKVQAAFVIWKWLFLMTLNKILMLSSLDYQNNNNTWQFYSVFQKNTVRLWLTKVVAPLERHLNTVQTSVKPLIPWRGGWVSLSTQIKWLMVTTKALTVRAKRVRGSWSLGYQRPLSIWKQWQMQATKPEEDLSESKVQCTQISSFSLYITYDHSSAEYKLGFDKFLSNVLPLPWSQKRYWTVQEQCQENLLHVGGAEEWTGIEGGKEERKQADQLTPSQLVPKGTGLHNKNQGSQVPTRGVWQPTWGTKPCPPRHSSKLSAFLRTMQ